MAWCLLSSTLQTATTFPNLCNLANWNHALLIFDGSISCEMCPIAAKAQAVEVQADLLLDSSVKMKRLQNVLSSRTCFLWLYWQWVGDQNCGLLSALRMNFLVYGQILCCRTDSLTMNSDGGVEALKKAKSKWTVMNLPQLGFMSSIFQSLITVWSLSNQLMFLFSAPP